MNILKLKLVLMATLSITSFNTLAQTVIVYCQPNCPPCENTEALLDKMGVSYKKCDIKASQECMDQFTMLGGVGTPLIKINGKVLTGFDRKSIEEALGINGAKRMDHTPAGVNKK